MVQASRTVHVTIPLCAAPLRAMVRHVDIVGVHTRACSAIADLSRLHADTAARS